MGAAVVLGNFISEMKFEKLPASVIKAAKERLIDFIGVALLGNQLGAFKPLRDLLIEGGQPRGYTIIGEGKQASCLDATFVNSFMAHSTYYEDGARIAGGHPSSVVIPSALGAAEKMGAGGRDLIEAIVAGYEIFVRIGKAGISQINRGFQPTATVGTLASAAAASKILRVGPKQIANSLEIAAPLGAGLLISFKEPKSQPLQVGKACQTGLLAALLASREMPGAEGALEEGFFRAFCSEEIRLDTIYDSLGREYMLPTTYLKIHGGCRHNHPSIDAVSKLILEHGITPDQVESINVKTYSVAISLQIINPQTPQEAMFNIPFSLALQLHLGNTHWESFNAENLRSPAIRSLMNKIRLEADSGMDTVFPEKRRAEAEIATIDGRKLTGSTEYPKGEPENPLTIDEIEQKFKRLSAGKIGRRRSEEIWNLINQLEEIENVNSLLQRLY